MRDCWLIVVLISFSCLSLATRLYAQQPLYSGDTLLYGLDMLPADPRVANLNRQGFWNFSSLNSPFWKQVVIRDAGDGELVYNGLDGLAQQFTSTEDGVFYTRIQSRINGVPVWSDRTMIPWRPFLLEEGTWYRGVANFKVPLEVLASQKDENLSLADSVYISCAWEIYVDPDVNGTVQLQDRSTFEAVRHKHQIQTNTTMHVNRNQTAKEMPLAFEVELPGSISSGTSYYFWSDDSGGPLGAIQEDEQGRASKAMYLSLKAEGKRVVASAPKGPDIIVNPNPSFGDVRFEVFNLEGSGHRIEVYSIIGVLLKTIDLEASGSFSYPVSLADLNKGTYIYRLVDSFDKTIKSKRLVIITP